MREYGKVYTAFWSSDDTISMSEDGRMLALYLMTCPHGNMLGCFRLTDAYAADDLKWTVERVSKGFAELFEKGFAYRCGRSFWVFIRQYLKWNQFENPNVGKAAGKVFESLPAPASMKALLINALREFSPWFPASAFDKFAALSIPFENPFERVCQTGAVAVTVATTGTATEAGANPLVEPPLDDVKTIFAYWQKVMESPGSVLDAKRRRLIETALKSYSPSDICKAIRGCSKSPHNMGQNAQKTKYNGLGLILRDAEHVDRFIGLDAGNARASPANETIEETNARVMREVLDDELGIDENTIEMES